MEKIPEKERKEDKISSRLPLTRVIPACYDEGSSPCSCLFVSYQAWSVAKNVSTVIFHEYSSISRNSGGLRRDKHLRTECMCMCVRIFERERGREREREREDITRWGRKNAFIIYREKERHGVVLSWFSGPFFRAVFPDHRAPTFLPWPFDIKRRKPLSSYRVKRLFSNLLADIGFITFPRLSLSLSATFLSMLFHPVFS